MSPKDLLHGQRSPQAHRPRLRLAPQGPGGALAATRLQTEGEILLHDAVFVAKDEDGSTRVTETVDPTPGNAALDGAFWGMLFGTLLAGPVGTLVGGAVAAGAGALRTAKLIDIGVPDATVQKLRETVSPGTTALARSARATSTPRKLVAGLHRFAGARAGRDRPAGRRRSSR